MSRQNKQYEYEHYVKATQKGSCLMSNRIRAYLFTGFFDKKIDLFRDSRKACVPEIRLRQINTCKFRDVLNRIDGRCFQ